MADTTTCIIAGCDKPKYARGACATHYGIAYRTGDLDSLRPPGLRLVHTLSGVDLESLRAICAACGSVEIYVRMSKGKPSPRCVVARREQRGYSSHKPGAPRRWALAKKYRMTVADYDRMVAAQGGKCAICEKVCKLVVDHNHETGVVRALLCQSCNIGIGFLGDSPSRLVTAALYLGTFTAQGA